MISTYNEGSDIDEPTTQDQEETVVSSLGIGVSGDHDHKPLSLESKDNADMADLRKEWCQNDEDDPEAELAKEYLKMGGGFCLDEDDDNKEPGTSGCSPPTEGLTELDHRGETEASINPDVAAGLSVAALPKNNEEDNIEIRPVSFLSAMPNLRRKRKKV